MLPRPRVSQPRPSRPSPFLESAPTHSLPRLVAPSGELPRPLSRSAHTTVELRRSSTAGLWPSSSVCRVRCLGGLCPFASNAGHPLVCPQPLYFTRSTLTGVLPVQPELRRRRPEAPLRPRRCSSAPEFPLEVSNPLCPYFPVCYVVPCAIARRSKSAPPLGCSAAVYALWCPHTGAMPTTESAVPP